MEDKLITLNNGHEMYQSVYNTKADYFKKCIENTGAKVVAFKRPVKQHDYGFVVETKDPLPQGLYTHFSKAGLRTTLQILTGQTVLVYLRT